MSNFRIAMIGGRMVKLHAAFLCVLVFSLAGAATTDDKPIKAADVPREFKGTFAWKDLNTPYELVLKIDKITEKDGMIRFSGTHSYDPGEYVMKIEGTIDAKSLRVSIFETEVLNGGGEIEGSFAGPLS